MARAIKITSLSGALTVTITGPSGAAPTVYADSSFANTTAMPATVADGTTQTFWLQSPGAYTLSVKAGGVEIAAPNNTTRTVDLETPGTVAVLNYDGRFTHTVAGDSERGSDLTDSSATYLPALTVDVATYGGGVIDAVAHIQSKIDAAKAAGGGTVYLPPGTYNLVATTTAGGLTWHLLVNGDYVQIVAAPGAKLLSTVSGANPLHITGAAKPAGGAAWASNTYALATVKTMTAASKGATSVTCATPADAGTFAAGDYVLIRTGQTLDGSSAEPDSEVNLVVAANATTGVVTLAWPLVKDYAQEYYITGTSGRTTTSVTANLAPFGIAKVTDRTLTGVKVKGVGFDCTSTAIIGGQLVDYDLAECWGSITNGGLMSQGNYRRGRITGNKVHTRGIGGWVYAFTTATGTSDVDVTGNVFTGERVVYAHMHEGSANIDVHDNVIQSTQSAADENAVSIRSRAYNIRVHDNTIINAGTGNAIYVDSLGTGGGTIEGNTIRGGFSNAISVAASGWNVGPNHYDGALDLGVYGIRNRSGVAITPKGASGFRYTPEGARVAFTPTLNTLYAVPIWVAGGSFTELGVRVTSAAGAGGIVKLGIYADNGLGQPGNLISGSTGQIDATLLGGQAVALSPNLPLIDGLYWLAAVAQVAAPAISGIVGANQYPVTTYSADPATANAGYSQTGVSAALPTTWGAVASNAVSNGPCPYLTRA